MFMAAAAAYIVAGIRAEKTSENPRAVYYRVMKNVDFAAIVPCRWLKMKTTTTTKELKTRVESNAHYTYENIQTYINISFIIFFLLFSLSVASQKKAFFFSHKRRWIVSQFGICLSFSAFLFFPLVILLLLFFRGWYFLLVGVICVYFLYFHPPFFSFFSASRRLRSFFSFRGEIIFFRFTLSLMCGTLLHEN